MLASFLITFREAFEAALLIGIIAGYAAKIERKDLYGYIRTGIIGAVIASATVALVFKTVYGELHGTAEQLFEGTTALAGAIVLTYMIFWMAQNSKKLREEFQEKIELSLSEGQKLGIVALSFIAVFREGVETVLFLGTLFINSPVDTFLGFFIGMAVVIAISIIMFTGIHFLDIGNLFRYTSILLIFFSAGLIATGVHEFNEAGIIPEIVEHVWNMNPPLNPDGSYPLLHENGLIGGGLKALFGYNASPSLTEVLAYAGYWIVIGIIVIRSFRKRNI